MTESDSVQTKQYMVTINSLPQYVEAPDGEISVDIANNKDAKVWVLSPSNKWRSCYIIDRKQDQHDTKWLIHYNGFHSQFDEYISSKSDRISLIKPNNIIPWYLSSYCVPTIGFIYNLKGESPDNYQYIISCIRNDALQNDIHIGSELIKINGTFINELSGYEAVNKYLDKAVYNLFTKNIEISLKFKIDTNLLTEKGVHLQFDITFDNVTDDHLFPYYKFTKDAIQTLMDNIFEDKVKIYQIYGNQIKKGVSILLFVDIDKEECDKFEREIQRKHVTRQQLIVCGYIHQLIDINDMMIPLDIIHLCYCFYSQRTAFYQTTDLIKKEGQIQESMKELISNDCMVKFVQQRYGIKSNALDKGYSDTLYREYMSEKISLMNLIYTVKGCDDGRNAWYIILVDPDKFDAFSIALKAPIIHLDKLGYILMSAYGSQPSAFQQNICFQMFDFKD